MKGLPQIIEVAIDEARQKNKTLQDKFSLELATIKKNLENDVTLAIKAMKTTLDSFENRNNVSLNVFEEEHRKLSILNQDIQQFQKKLDKLKYDMEHNTCYYNNRTEETWIRLLDEAKYMTPLLFNLYFELDKISAAYDKIMNSFCLY